MGERSSSSATMSRTRCAGWPAGTNSCTEAGSSHASFTRHGRKLFVMPPSESPPTAEVEPPWPYRDTLLGRGWRGDTGGQRHPYEFRQAARAHLLHHPGAVDLHRPRAGAQVVGDG